MDTSPFARSSRLLLSVLSRGGNTEQSILTGVLSPTIKLTGLFRTGLRCDYLLINEDKSDAYLIELKGADIVHAVDQLEATAQTLKLALQNYHIKYRLVHTKARTHALMETKFKKFCQRHRKSGEFLRRENTLEETI